MIYRMSCELGEIGPRLRSLLNVTGCRNLSDVLYMAMVFTFGTNGTTPRINELALSHVLTATIISVLPKRGLSRAKSRTRWQKRDDRLGRRILVRQQAL